jgi:hypothetical protein
MRVGFKRVKLGKIERVPNLTCHRLTAGHCFSPYPFKSGIGIEKVGKGLLIFLGNNLNFRQQAFA